MSKPIKNINCLNCGHPLKGDENFCPYCGQKNDVRPLSIGLYFSNFLSNFFNFDGRIWRTIIYLVKAPGKVPADYIAGKRIAYSNPFQFLLQVSILYFLLSGLFSTFLHKSTLKIINADISMSESKLNYAKFFDSIDDKTNFVEQLKNQSLAKKTKDSLIQNILNQQPKNITFKNGITKIGSINYDDLLDYLHRKGIYYSYFPVITNLEKFDNQGFLPKILDLYQVIGNDVYRALSDKETLQKTGIKNTWANQLAVKFAKQIYLLFRDTDSRNRLKKSIISKISMALFFILPILALLFQIFYPKRHTYTETLVFIFYVQSVYFLVLLIELIGQYLLPFGIGLLLSYVFEIWFLYYLYRSTLKFYRQKKWQNALKIPLLVIPSYALLSAIGFLAITLISMVL